MDVRKLPGRWSLAGLCLFVAVSATAAAGNDNPPNPVSDTTAYWQRPSHCYVQAEFLFLDRDTKSMHQPLVIDVDSGDTLVETGDLGFDFEPGVRITLGINRCRYCGCSAWEFTYLGLFDSDASAGALGDDNLAVPGDLGFGAVNGLTLAESIHIDYSARLHSVEATFVKCWRECCGECRDTRLEFLAGFRYLSLGEDLDILGDNEGVAGAVYSVDADNHLYGAQLGARLRSQRHCWGWEALAKAGIYGNDASQQQIIVDELGVNDVLIRNAASGNRGNVAFVGEIGLSAVRQLSCTWALRVGYNVMWIEGVALAPNQLDFSDTLLSGTSLNTAGGVLLHGFSAGAEARW